MGRAAVHNVHLKLRNNKKDFRSQDKQMAIYKKLISDRTPEKVFFVDDWNYPYTDRKVSKTLVLQKVFNIDILDICNTLLTFRNKKGTRTLLLLC